ncbi:ABC transporter permease [Virgisporangium aurantiacum]
MKRPVLAVGKRLAAAALTLVAVSMVLFAGASMVPGDAASASLGISTTPEQIDALRAEWGLDRPLPVRYAEWMGAVLRGDLGTSLISHRPVIDVIAEPLWSTTVLVLIASAVTVPLAVLLGVLTGLRPGGRLDRFVSGVSLTVVAIPSFVVAGLLVMVFSVTLGLLPAVSLPPLGGTPLDRPEILVLPAGSLVLFATAWASRLVRATVVDANLAPNAEAARLAGVPERTVVWRHVLPTRGAAAVRALAPLFAWLVSALFGGTTVVEVVFNYPGLSTVLLTAVRNHDAAVLEGVGLLLAVVIVGSLIVADLLGFLANPKLRTGTP